MHHKFYLNRLTLRSPKSKDAVLKIRITLNGIVSQRNTKIEMQPNWYGAAGEIFDEFMLPNVGNLFRKMLFVQAN